MQTGDRDDANSVQEFGDCVVDKLLAILKRLAAAAVSVRLQEPLLLAPILGQTGIAERQHLGRP